MKYLLLLKFGDSDEQTYKWELHDIPEEAVASQFAHRNNGHQDCNLCSSKLVESHILLVQEFSP